MKKKLTAALLTMTLVCTGALSGCVTADPSAEERRERDHGCHQQRYGDNGPGRFHRPDLSGLFGELLWMSCSRMMRTVRSSTGRRKATR